MIAERILNKNSIGDTLHLRSDALEAMQSYADFYYWLGKEGWVKVGKDWGKITSNLPAVWISESILYNQYTADAEREITQLK